MEVARLLDELLDMQRQRRVQERFLSLMRNPPLPERQTFNGIELSLFGGKIESLWGKASDVRCDVSSSRPSSLSTTAPSALLPSVEYVPEAGESLRREIHQDVGAVAELPYIPSIPSPTYCSTTSVPRTLATDVCVLGPVPKTSTKEVLWENHVGRKIRIGQAQCAYSSGDNGGRRRSDNH